MDDNNHLQPLEDLCEQCDQEQARFIITELNIGCCETCRNDNFRDHDAEPIAERSDTRKSIYDAINLIKSMRPLAHILKVSLPEDEVVFEDFLDNMLAEVQNCQEQMDGASLSRVNYIYQKINSIKNDIFYHQNTVEI